MNTTLQNDAEQFLQEAEDAGREVTVHKIPKEFSKRFAELYTLVNTFCDSFLNDEYKYFSRLMAFAMCQETSPIRKGKPEGWAAGIIYTIGQVNFLTDPKQEPHMTSKQIAEGFGISKATMQSKAKIIREGLGIYPLDPAWTLPSNWANNPMIWMMETENGVIIDVRNSSREFQAELYEKGLIPYIPADQNESSTTKTIST